MGFKFFTEETTCWEIWLSPAVDNYHKFMYQSDCENGIIPPIQHLSIPKDMSSGIYKSLNPGFTITQNTTSE